MKRSNASVAATPNRRSLILNHHALLNDPEVVAFLSDAAPPVYTTLADKLVLANEPALLLELIRLSERSTVTLVAIDDNDDPQPLPDGLFDYVLQHIDQVPCMKDLTVEEAVLSAATCAQLQTTLGAPTCSLKFLTFSHCSFADVHVQFPTNAATIESIDWTDELNDQAGLSSMDQVLPALAGWTQLAHLSLIRENDPITFAVVTQLLLHNPRITSLYLVTEVAPVAPGNPDHQPHQDPGLLLDLLANDRLPLARLIFQVRDAHNIAFNDYCLRRLTQCLMTNTTLNFLEVPGIRMCTPAARDRFRTGLTANHALISLAPLDVFNDQMPAPVRRNQSQRYWFSKEFVLGAAEAFLSLLKVPADLGLRLAGHLAPTPVERIYCGPVMALICKSTHQNAVKLRSSGLKEALLIYIRNNDQERCLALLNPLLQHQLDLLPGDKQQVIDCAKKLGRLNFLPPGYAH